MFLTLHAFYSTVTASLSSIAGHASAVAGTLVVVAVGAVGKNDDVDGGGGSSTRVNQKGARRVASRAKSAAPRMRDRGAPSSARAPPSLAFSLLPHAARSPRCVAPSTDLSTAACDPQTTSDV